MKIKGSIIITVLVSSFRPIWIPMLCIYGHYKYLIPSVWGLFLDVRFWRLQTVPWLKGLRAAYISPLFEDGITEANISFKRRKNSLHNKT